MKTKEFEKAIDNLNQLFDSLNGRGFLTPEEISTFNHSHQVINAFYSFHTGKNEQVVLPWNHPLFIEKWDEWKKYKKDEFGFRYKTAKSEQRQLKDLCDQSKGDMNQAILLIEYAMNKTWRSFFPIPGSKEKVKTSETYKNNIAQRLINR